jgi:hypothetical protein
LQEAPVFTLAPFTRVELSDRTLNGDSYVEPSEETRIEYLSGISKISFPYQKRSLDRVKNSDHLAVLEESMRGLAWRHQQLGGKLNKSLVVGSSLGYVTLNLDGDEAEVVAGDTPKFEYTKVTTDARLLDAVIRRKPGYSGFTDAHMNVADGGNHLDWHREGAYDPGLTSLLFFL